MLYVQKFHNLEDIDLEFIPELSELLKEHIPSFDWFKEKEKELPLEIHFVYLLFFGNKHNSPVGFARIELHKRDVQEQKSFFSKFSKKASSEPKKHARWRTPFSTNLGFIFEASYEKEGLETLLKSLEDLSKRDDIISQDLTLSPYFHKLELNLLNIKSNIDENKIHFLHKSYSSYQEYLKNLPSEEFKKVRSLWIEANKNYTLNYFDSFKETFEYRGEEGIKLHNLLKKDPIIKYSSFLKTTFITVEENKSIKGLVLFYKGEKENAFYEIIRIDEAVGDILLHENAILHFYETKDVMKLHYLGDKSDFDFFATRGFEKVQTKLISL